MQAAVAQWSYRLPFHYEVAGSILASPSLTQHFLLSIVLHRQSLQAIPHVVVAIIFPEQEVVNHQKTCYYNIPTPLLR